MALLEEGRVAGHIASRLAALVLLGVGGVARATLALLGWFAQPEALPAYPKLNLWYGMRDLHDCVFIFNRSALTSCCCDAAQVQRLRGRLNLLEKVRRI